MKQPPGHAIVVVENWHWVPSQYPGRYRTIVFLPEHASGGGESHGLSPGPPEEDDELDDELDDDELDASASPPASPASCVPESTGSVSSKEHATNGIAVPEGGSVEGGAGGGLPGVATPSLPDTLGSITPLDAKTLEPPVHAVTSAKATTPPPKSR